MKNMIDPQNDRELLIQLNSKMEQLSDSIDRFATTLKDIEDKKLAEVDRRIDVLENWRAKWGGALAALGVIATILSIASIFKSFF